MKKFTDIFIRRPVLASAVSLFILIAGVFSVFHLPIRLLPKVTDPLITITTSYPGASSGIMQSFVTSTIEGAMSGIKNMAYISSISRQGISIIQIHMNLGASPSKALGSVITKVSSVNSLLPRKASKPDVVVGSSNSNPLMILAFTSKQLKRRAVADYLRRVIAPQLEAISGVAEAKVLGRKYAMRLWLNPLSMAAIGVTPSEVIHAIQSNNIETAAGNTKGNSSSFNIQTTTNLNSAKQFNNVLIKSSNGGYVKLKNIGKAKLGDQDTNISAFYNGQAATMIFIKPLPGANPITVSNQVKEKLAALRKTLPLDIKVHDVVNSGRYISASMQEVEKSLIEAAIIVMLVIFLFLGSLRSVLIPVITIPLSLIGVCSLLYLFSYSINTLTLLALVLAIGLVVDDAIVVVENIFRHIETGDSVMSAAIKGAREIACPVIAMSLTLAMVFVPIALVGGLTGQLFIEFALTLSACVILSGVIALTLSPMLASKCLTRNMILSDNSPAYSRFLQGYQKIYEGYVICLNWTLQNKKILLIAWIMILLALAWLIFHTPTMLAPSEDQGMFMAISKAPNSSSTRFLNYNVAQLNQVYQNFKPSDSQTVVSGIPSRHKALSFISLKPWSKREQTAMALQPQLQAKVNKVPGIETVIINPSSLPGSSGLPLQVVLKSSQGFHALYHMSNAIMAKARQSGIFSFIESNLNYNQPVLKIVINRNAATVLGVSMKEIGSTLSLMLGGNHVQQFDRSSRSYYVTPQIEPQYRLNPQELYNIHIQTKSGQLVPLSSLARIVFTVEPEALNQFQKMNAVTLSGEMAAGYTLSNGISFLTQTARHLFPQDLLVSYAGQTRQLVEEGHKMLWLILGAILSIFLLLAIQFESYRAPLIILLGSAPLAAFGAVLALYLGLGSLNIYTEIALLALVGLICKHGILIITFANELRLQGNTKLAAIKNAMKKRLRPILMTTAAMVCGALPLVFASGAGSVSRNQLGVVIVFGMTIGTCLALFILPTLYMVLSPNNLEKHDAD